jgi:hypothetical protein
MNQLFYEEWLEKLSNNFSDEHGLILITRSNIFDILQTLDLLEVISIEDGLNMLAYYRDYQATFEEYANDMVKFI